LYPWICQNEWFELKCCFFHFNINNLLQLNLPGSPRQYNCVLCTWIFNYLCNQCLSSLKLWVRIQLYVIKFVSDLRQVGRFLQVLRFSPPIKLTASCFFHFNINNLLQLNLPGSPRQYNCVLSMLNNNHTTHVSNKNFIKNVRIIDYDRD
jgi:hypothetical protein